MNIINDLFDKIKKIIHKKPYLLNSTNQYIELYKLNFKAYHSNIDKVWTIIAFMATLITSISSLWNLVNVLKDYNKLALLIALLICMIVLIFNIAILCLTKEYLDKVSIIVTKAWTKMREIEKIIGFDILVAQEAYKNTSLKDKMRESINKPEINNEDTIFMLIRWTKGFILFFLFILVITIISFIIA